MADYTELAARLRKEADFYESEDSIGLVPTKSVVIDNYRAAAAAIEELARDAGRLREEKDEAYRQRNILVAALSRLFPSGIKRTNIDGWSEDWHGCVYIDLPTGQISYHYHDSQEHLFAELPPYTKPWDGHNKQEVEKRLAAIDAAQAEAAGKPE